MKNTKKIYQAVHILGALMFAAGCALPFFVGTGISPRIYNFLQIGGFSLLVLGWIAREMSKEKHS